MRKKYPSDISREQFEHIKAELESARKVTKPRKVELYEVFCAILYVLRTGCQWRAVPHDFPKWRVVYSYFQQWSEVKAGETESIFEKIQIKVVGLAREKAGKEGKASYVIVDAQSVKNTDTAKKKATMQAKKYQE